MGNNRIINVAHPRNPANNPEHECDAVTAKYMYDYINFAYRKYFKANEDNVLNGQLNIKQHRIVDLADPVNSYDAVNLRYVSSRIQAITDENTKLSNRMTENQRLILANWPHGKYIEFTMPE